MPMKWKRPSNRIVSWQVVFAAVVAGGIVHIATTLSVPFAATASAYKRVATLPANKMVVLPPATPTQQPLPFLSPEARFAICRFDLSDGPIAISVTLPERGWLLTVHSAVGDVFYAAPGQDVRSMDVGIRLVPAAERLLGLLPGGRSMDGDGTSISSPTRHGLVLVRAPVSGEAFGERIEKVLARASCTLDKS
jgi:uncharacterized membrane protein